MTFKDILPSLTHTLIPPLICNCDQSAPVQLSPHRSCLSGKDVIPTYQSSEDADDDGRSKHNDKKQVMETTGECYNYTCEFCQTLIQGLLGHLGLQDNMLLLLNCPTIKTERADAG